MSAGNGNHRRDVMVLTHHVPRPKGREQASGLTPKQYRAALRQAEKRIAAQRREIQQLHQFSSSMNNALRLLVKRLLPYAMQYAKKGRPRLLQTCAKIADQVSTIPKKRPR